MLYPAKGASYISVSELERGINENLAAMGVPVECMLYPYCDYGRWLGVFRFTTLDDPDYSYPAPNLEDLETQEEIEREFNRYFSTMGLEITTIEPVSKDGPVTEIRLSCQGFAHWDEDSPAFSQVLMQAILITCGAENGEAELEALHAAEPTEEYGNPCRTVQKDRYILKLYDYTEEGMQGYVVYYPDFPDLWHDQKGLNGEALLDPALLAYDFQVEGPMVKDGYFNTRQPYSGYFSNRSSGHLPIDSAINDYLMYTRSEINIGGEVYDAGYEAYKFFNGYGVSDDQLFNHDAYGLMINKNDEDAYEVFVYYNTNVEDYYTDSSQYIPPEYWWMRTPEPEIENILRIPIAVSLLLDEGMDEEEAVQLHTHEIPYDYEDVNEDGVLYRVTVYGPGMWCISSRKSRKPG